MYSYILVYLFSSFFAHHLHQSNALLYKLQTAHSHPIANIPTKNLMLVPTSNEIARQDFVYLFMMPPTNQFAHISMPALHILCYLRMAKIPYYILSNQFLLASPTGKPQFAQYNGQIFDDPKKLIEEIKRNKNPQKIVEKSKKEIRMEEALDTMQNILHADMLASSKKIKYDGLFDEDGSSQLELWMQDEGLKEQMYLELTKIDAANDKGSSETIDTNTHDELARNEIEFMKAYFNIKNQRELKGKENFFISHGINFMDLHGLVFPKVEEISDVNEEHHTNNAKWEEREIIVEEEYEDLDNTYMEITPISKRMKKITMKVPKIPHHSLASNKIHQRQQGDHWESFEKLMDKRVADRLKGEMAKLKMSIVEFSKALSQQTIKIPLPTAEEEKLKKKEQEEMEKQNENQINKIADSRNLSQRVNSFRTQTITKRLENLSKWSKLAAKTLKSQKQIRQFDHKKLEECNEEELLEAFKHAVDVLAPIVKPFSSYDDGFLFKKATATEARLLATLGYLFTKSQSITKFSQFMASKMKQEFVEKNTSKAMIGPQFEWVNKRCFGNKNLQILYDYFAMRRERLGLDIGTLDALKTRPWSLKKLMVDEQKKYTGPYPFKTDSMKWLPQWANEKNWSKPQDIIEKPLNEETAGPDHKILTTILEKISTYFWENLNGRQEFEVGKKATNFSVCRMGLMHIVASYLCGLDYKNRSKNSKCSKWHLKKFEKLGEVRQQLLDPIFIPMKRIIKETVEEIIGFEDKILGAIKQAKKKNAQEAQENEKEEKGNLNEPIEGNFMLDLF